jgi:TonB family protein
MGDAESIPRIFGSYLLTAKLGSDALGRVYRARRAEKPDEFFRLRIFEARGLDAERVLTAIEENGAVHDFLKNPAIARNVELDSVEGDPFLAFREFGGRTLDVLLSAARERPFPIPPEHALLIAEKIATGLDHAYNTLIDGERTLHGLLWPGFVEISDEGETQLTGFGLAEGILASRSEGAIREALFPYLAPEVRSSGKPSKTGDVYSAGAILLSMLTGALPPVDGAAAAPGSARMAGQGEPIPPDIATVLKTALAESPEARYETAGTLRRDLGKILFSGRYSPSTFNLAFFLTNLFRDQIASEQQHRKEEAALDYRKFVKPPAPPPRPSQPIVPPRFGAAPFEPEPAKPPDKPVTAAARKFPFAGAAIGVLVLAAIAGGTLLILRRRAPAKPPPKPVARVAPAPAPPAPPPPQPTGELTPEQYKEEVARRVAEELKKLDVAQKARQEKDAAARLAALKPQPAPVTPKFAEPKPLPVTEATPPPAAPPPPSPAPEPPPPAAPTAPVREGDLVDIGEVDTPPAIVRVVKPQYPPVALQMRVSGTVILSVLVTERGGVADVKVLRGAGGNMGLNEAAVKAVQSWTFKPAMKGGVPVRTWFTVPIPFVL